MSQDWVFWRRVLAISLLCLFIQKAFGEPLYPLVEGETKPLRPGTTAQIFADWNDHEIHPENLPDRTFRSIWVRMFPLVSQPLGDPYPETVNFNNLMLVNSGGLKIYGLDDGALLASGTIIEFDFGAARVKVNGTAYTLEPLWIVPNTSITTTMNWDKGSRLANGKPAEVKVEVRGGVVIKRSLHAPVDGPPPTEHWSAINVVTVNQYMRSVVPSEVIASWKTETLRAQAIAARTYGLYEVALSREGGQDFDVDPSTWFQSYQGVQFWMRDTKRWKQIELTATTAAVEDTGGKVIMHAGEIIKAYFSSNSGGRTCTSSECFETSGNPPYLREVDDAPGIKTAPGGTWGTRATLTPALIKAKLKEHGLEVTGTIKKLEHLERGPSGRTWRLRLVMTNGTVTNLSRLHTRKVMHLFGPIRSFDYELGVVSGGKQRIVGHGYGHGVGLSQWGAQLYAKAGWNAQRILQHFYYNVIIKDLAP